MDCWAQHTLSLQALTLQDDRCRTPLQPSGRLAAVSGVWRSPCHKHVARDRLWGPVLRVRTPQLLGEARAQEPRARRGPPLARWVHPSLRYPTRTSPCRAWHHLSTRSPQLAFPLHPCHCVVDSRLGWAQVRAEGHRQRLPLAELGLPDRGVLALIASASVSSWPDEGGRVIAVLPAESWSDRGRRPARAGSSLQPAPGSQSCGMARPARQAAARWVQAPRRSSQRTVLIFLKGKGKTEGGEGGRGGLVRRQPWAERARGALSRAGWVWPSGAGV